MKNALQEQPSGDVARVLSDESPVSGGGEDRARRIAIAHEARRMGAVLRRARKPTRAVSVNISGR